jgi:hypothetical protein
MKNVRQAWEKDRFGSAPLAWPATISGIPDATITCPPSADFVILLAGHFSPRKESVMPLKKGKSQATISKNIEEFHGGETYEKTKAKFGKKTADKQAVAVALNKARESGAKIPRKKSAKKAATKKTKKTVKKS